MMLFQLVEGNGRLCLPCVCLDCLCSKYIAVHAGCAEILADIFKLQEAFQELLYQY